jgi:hypothetical protein
MHFGRLSVALSASREIVSLSCAFRGYDPPVIVLFTFRIFSGGAASFTRFHQPPLVTLSRSTLFMIRLSSQHRFELTKDPKPHDKSGHARRGLLQTIIYFPHLLLFTIHYSLSPQPICGSCIYIVSVRPQHQPGWPAYPILP